MAFSHTDPIARLLALGGELAPPAPGRPRHKYDLAHMHTLLDALDNPQHQFPSVLIAGTNGKGSTAATLASILQAAGHRTGLYTSPHLERPNERIRIGNAEISDEALGSLFPHVESVSANLVAAGRLPRLPSFFETMTAIAFLHFATPQMLPGMHSRQKAVEIAILEVGLGGRLDATNVVDPILSILTDISLDHTEWLGDTIAEITREKAGILRRNGALVTLPQHPEANQAIGEAAVPLEVEAISAAEFLPGRQPDQGRAEISDLGRLRNRYTVPLPATLFSEDFLEIDSPLFGDHQKRNIALAVAAAIYLHQKAGFSLTVTAIQQGVRQTHWLGRLQVVLLPSRPPVLLDAAHNPAGAWALRAALSASAPDLRKTLVFGCMRDKAIDEVAQILFPIMDEVILTRLDSPRGAQPEQLRTAAARTGVPFTFCPVAGEALQTALRAAPATGLVVIAGSISLVGACLHRLSLWVGAD